VSAIINNYQENTFWGAVWAGAGNGAVDGVKCSSLLLGSLLTLGAAYKALEASNRSLGFEPNWPALRGDCETVQFQHSEMCRNKRYEFISFALATVAAGAAIGAVCGAVSAAVRPIFVYT